MFEHQATCVFFGTFVCVWIIWSWKRISELIPTQGEREKESAHARESEGEKKGESEKDKEKERDRKRERERDNTYVT